MRSAPGDLMMTTSNWALWDFTGANQVGRLSATDVIFIVATNNLPRHTANPDIWVLVLTSTGSYGWLMSRYLRVTQ